MALLSGLSCLFYYMLSWAVLSQKWLQKNGLWFLHNFFFYMKQWLNQRKWIAVRSVHLGHKRAWSWMLRNMCFVRWKVRMTDIYTIYYFYIINRSSFRLSLFLKIFLFTWFCHNGKVQVTRACLEKELWSEPADLLFVNIYCPQTVVPAQWIFALHLNNK